MSEESNDTPTQPTEPVKAPLPKCKVYVTAGEGDAVRLVYEGEHVANPAGVAEAVRAAMTHVSRDEEMTVTLRTDAHEIVATLGPSTPNAERDATPAKFADAFRKAKEPSAP